MNSFFEMVREGGPLAMVAVFFGLLGAMLGVIAVIVGLGGSRAGFGLGVATLILSTLSSGAGIGGTLLGKRQVDTAMAFVDNPVDRDLIALVGHQEASGAATLGAFGSLLPLVLGALGALAGARAQSNPPRRQGLDASQTELSGSESSGRAVLVAVFIGIAALGASGAWVTGHRPPPPSKYGFDPDDHDAWDLARGVDDVQRAVGAADFEGTSRACERLSTALGNYWKSPDRRQWPRVFVSVPPSISGWREAAGQCIDFELSPPPSGTSAMRAMLSTEGLLESPLLLDDARRERVLAREAQRLDAPPAEPDDSEAPPPGGPGGALDKTAILAVVRSAQPKVRACFERELIKNPKLEGKLMVELTVAESGRVTSARETGQPFPEKRVSECVCAEMKKLEFPASDGGPVTVNFPFMFRAAP